MQNSQPIGVFDSGLGGLSVVRSIRKLLPNENIVYFGDSANAPYGTRTKAEVALLSSNVVNKLLEFKVKAIVIACNTASSAAGALFRSDLDIPIILMEPALKPAVEAFPEGKILVLATAMTLKEEKFQRLYQSYPDAKVDLMAAGELVEVVENNNFSQTEAVLKELNVARDYDAVVLGCTHFVFLEKEIQQYFKAATIIDGNLGTAKHLKNILQQADMLNAELGGTVNILNSDSSQLQRSHQLLQNPVEQIKEISIRIGQVLESDKFSPLEAELLRLKYLEHKNIDYRMLSRKHGKSIKFVQTAFAKADHRLYNLLK